MSNKKTVLISLAILTVTAVVTIVIFSTEPTAKRAGATKETAMLVEVIPVERGNFQPKIVTTGTVIPSQDIYLSPRVSGEVTNISTGFAPGGFVKRGEVLLQIDPSDYENTLQLRESDLLEANADLEIEMGRQNVALKDFQLLDESIAGENRSLVLREPQLNAAKSRLQAAEAAVNQAKLNLDRTTIRAPFNAHILSRNVSTGSQVSPGENLGRLVGLETYWIEVEIPLSRLRWLSFPDIEGEKGALVKIRNRNSWNAEEYREGHLYKLIGSLENQTRLARVLVAVEDPLALQAESSEKQPLIIGAFMETTVAADTIKDVIRLDRDHIRLGETVWVMAADTLQINKVNIIFQDAEYAYLTEGLNRNDRIVTTNLTTVAEGVRLRVDNTESSGNNNIQNDANISSETR